MPKKISKDNKYIVADKLASGFAPSVGNISSLDSHVAFGIILNKKFSTKGKVVSLKDLYSFEDASHITNLILRRLKGATIVEIDL
jgi:hypothetical protein